MVEKLVPERIVPDIQSDEMRVLHQRQHVTSFERIRGERKCADARVLQRGHDARCTSIRDAVLAEIQSLQLAPRGKRRADGQRPRVTQVRAEQIEAFHVLQSLPRRQRLAAGGADRVAAEIEFLHV